MWLPNLHIILQNKLHLLPPLKIRDTSTAIYAVNVFVPFRWQFTATSCKIKLLVT